METAKNLVSTFYGLLVAFLLPGLLVIITIGLVYEPIGNQLLQVSGSTAPSGLSIFLFLAAILAGMQLNVIRWAIYPRGIGRKKSIKPGAMAALGNAKRVEHFRLILDQVFRFHQFAGAQSIILPFFFAALTYHAQLELRSATAICWLVLELAVECLTIWSAKHGWELYVDRANALAEMDVDKL